MENLYYFLLLIIITIISLFSLLIISKHFLFNNHVKNRKLPPSPPALPIIGHLHLIKNLLYQELTSLSSRYGPVFFLRFGCRSFLAVSSPSAVEECFTKNDIVLANRPQTMAGDRLTYNYTTLGMMPYGHLWRVVRRVNVVESFFSRGVQLSGNKKFR